MFTYKEGRMKRNPKQEMVRLSLDCLTDLSDSGISKYPVCVAWAAVLLYSAHHLCHNGQQSLLQQIQSLHTLIMNTRNPLTVDDFSFLEKCKNLKKLDLVQTNLNRWNSVTAFNGTDQTGVCRSHFLLHIHSPFFICKFGVPFCFKLHTPPM